MADNIEKEVSEFYSLIEKIDCKNPDNADIQKAESLMKKYYPDICAIGMNMAGSILKHFLHMLNPQKSQQLFFEAEVLSIKKELGYSSSNQIEKLIIDQVLLCWAGMNYAEAHMHNLLKKGGYSYDSGNYWQENLTRYQKRYLRAIETLARVRKLNISIALQLNIATEGGKQLNVSGAQQDSK